MSDRPETGSVLDAILARTRERVAAEQGRRPLDASHPAVRQAPPVRPFGEALVRPGRLSVIAEHKRRSPSRGTIREDLAPADVARGYEKAGAAAISVLTDEPFFGGRMAHLEEVRGATALPVLRKDFVLDPWQVWEARAAGADAVLLIVAALTDAELAVSPRRRARGRPRHPRRGARPLRARPRARGGVADRRRQQPRPEDAHRVARDGPRRSRRPSPTTWWRWRRAASARAPTSRRLREAGFDAFLVGERLMAAPDPGEALKRLLEEAS